MQRRRSRFRLVGLGGARQPHYPLAAEGKRLAGTDADPGAQSASNTLDARVRIGCSTSSVHSQRADLIAVFLTDGCTLRWRTICDSERSS